MRLTLGLTFILECSAPGSAPPRRWRGPQVTGPSDMVAGRDSLRGAVRDIFLLWGWDSVRANLTAGAVRDIFLLWGWDRGYTDPIA